MKVRLATAGSFAWSQQPLEEFIALAARDRVKKHTLTRDAQAADLILFVDLHQHPGGATLPLLHAHPLVQRFPRKIFVYDERDRSYPTFPGLYTSARRSNFDPRRQIAAPYIRLHNPLATTTSAAITNVPDLLFSFQGARTHRVRDAVLALRHSRALIEDTSHLNFFEDSGDTAALERQKNRYAHTISRSKFVLCPRGHGPSSFRLFETLSSGRVPVIISDEWVALRGPDWARCSLHVPQGSVNSLPVLLEACEADYPQLARAARQTYEDYFAPDVLWHRLMNECEALLTTGKKGNQRFYQLNKLYISAWIRKTRS